MKNSKPTEQHPLSSGPEDEEIEQLISLAKDKTEKKSGQGYEKKRRQGYVSDELPHKKLRKISNKLPLSPSLELSKPQPTTQLPLSTFLAIIKPEASPSQIPKLHNGIERLSISDTDPHNHGGMSPR